MRSIAAVCLVLLASCSTLSKPVYTQPIDPTTGAPVGPAVPVYNPDGSQSTVGDAIADTIDSLTPAITGTATALAGPFGGMLAAGLLAMGIGTLKKKQPPSAPPPGPTVTPTA